jgi:beta-lactamase superfamily II metal-dependent hydrolase
MATPKPPKPIPPKKKTLYVCYSNMNELPVYDKPNGKIVNRVLLSSYLIVTDSKQINDDKWLEIFTYGNDGWVREKNTTKTNHLKVFYVDVGQGDGALMEVGRSRFLFDGGSRKDSNMKRYLKWQYQGLTKNNYKVHFDGLFISHFDEDHYGGLIDIIADSNYTFKAIYVAGIGKFAAGKKETVLGDKSGDLLTTYFENLQDLKNKFGNDGQIVMKQFIKAVEKANKEGRLLEGIKRLCVINPSKPVLVVEDTINDLPFIIQVLGPIMQKEDHVKGFKWLKNASHTVNGHSLVLKVTYGTRSLLFGGDLNTDSEIDLLEFHKNDLSIFEVDVAKSCHHGSSEFTVDFMRALNPYGTVISSGDNESYSHPRADAIGCAGKYSRNEKPLVFSTELARSTNVPTQEIQYGLINLRSDGDVIYFAQKKETKALSDPWDSYGPL